MKIPFALLLAVFTAGCMTNPGSIRTSYPYHTITPPMVQAAMKGELATVKSELQGTPIDTQGTHGYTALHAAVLFGWEQVTAFCVEKEANLDIQDEDGFTPLMYAVRNADYKIVSILYLALAELDIQNNSGNTALMIAAAKGDDNLVLQLSQYSDLSIRNNNGLTALGLALKNDCRTTAAMLQAKGAIE